MLSRLGAALRAEARRTDERRAVVLSGVGGHADALRTVLDAGEVPRDRTTVVSGADLLACERLDPVHADRLLGQTRDAVVLDCRDRCDPNALGQVVGAVDGGGLLVVLTPPLSAWPERRDAFDASLAVPPFETDDVTGHFRRRLVGTLRAHPGIAIVDVDAGSIDRDGLTDPAPRRDVTDLELPADSAFPRAAYESCLTADQVDAVQAFERLREPGTALVCEADRGRGKSSAAGLAAASLASEGREVLVTAPDYPNAATVFERARELLARLAVDYRTDREDGPREITVGEGAIRFEPPDVAADQADRIDVLVVDEAAALPVDFLDASLGAPAVAFTSTIRGYEGTGRGFAVRFRDRLADARHAVTDVAMTAPIRYAAGDPIETWVFRALLLDAGPAADQLVEAATPETASYERLTGTDLRGDEHLLREVFGLLIVAHYRTEPADLARLLDAPNVAVRALTHDGHVVSVALLAREGDLPAETRAAMYEGERIAGNMIPDVLTSQLRDEDAGVPVGWRVMRIATHHAVRSRGLGSQLLDDVEDEFGEVVDWLGTGYGATPGLVDFWAANGYRSVHLSTSRNDRSGEHSAIMLKPISAAGRTLLERHTGWFLDRFPGMLSDPLAAVDPDVIRAVARTIDATPALDLSKFEWRVLAGAAHGTGLYDAAPEAFARLALRHLVAPGDDPSLTDRQERLLVEKTLQRRSWRTVADDLDFHSRRECMRALGETVGTLVEAHGSDLALTERERFE